MMPKFAEISFDTVIDRNHTDCEKFDQREQRFGRADVMPLWVADMDFAAPACVRKALAQRLEHPVFGYTFPADTLYEQLCGWFARRHQWALDPAQVMLAPGVVPSLFACVQALTQPGEGVLVPTPVYPPFLGAVQQTGRELIQSPLRETERGYTLDFEHLEREAANARMLLLCSPHNPVGRVWRADELKALIDLALRHRLVVVSDDIHCDLTYLGEKHLPLATLAPPELRLITALSPSKTFNIPALNLSALVVAHRGDSNAIQKYFQRQRVNPYNPFALVAFEAAYREGDAWLEALRAYLGANRQLVAEFQQVHPILRCHLPQASCLIWLDCRALSLSDPDLSAFFIEKARLGLNEGISFGMGGEGFMRLNIGTQKRVLELALAQLAASLKEF
ncbi:Aminotransferases class-I [gamma proteobacterium HdN1]|nr:Aminotransferases class-I [gamma proteobacterium HdN1]